MPKVKKVRTRTLYGYVKPVNDDFARADAKKRDVSFSLYIDALIESQRTGKPFNPVRPLTVAEKRLLVRAEKSE